jgi:hypothetical protein
MWPPSHWMLISLLIELLLCGLVSLLLLSWRCRLRSLPVKPIEDLLVHTIRNINITVVATNRLKATYICETSLLN